MIKLGAKNNGQKIDNSCLGTLLSIFVSWPAMVESYLSQAELSAEITQFLTAMGVVS